MNRKHMHGPRLLGFLALAAACLFVGSEQGKAVERIAAQVHMTHSQVVRIEGNHLVVRRTSGILQALEIPEGFRFRMNGSTLAVGELRPGMILADTVKTISRPILVKTVQIDNGTVWHTNGENVIIQDKNNKLIPYKIPGWAKIKVYGADLTVFDLRKGMKLNATIVTEEPQNAVKD
jgi:hypothetical protein